MDNSAPRIVDFLIETITTSAGGVSRMATAAALSVLQYSRKPVTARYAQVDEWVNAAAPSLKTVGENAGA